MVIEFVSLKTGTVIATYKSNKPAMQALAFMYGEGGSDMMIDQIGGNFLAAPSAQRTGGDKSLNFNKVLSEKTLALSEDAQASDARLETASKGAGQEFPSAKPVKIGTITSKNPTVSDLLIQNPDLKEDCWNIIFNRQNRDKAYTSIPNGTDIYYDPSTRELLWGDMMEKIEEQPAPASVPSKPERQQGPTALASVSPETGAGRLNGSLVDAVQPMIGKSYSDMDCYEFLVNGLSKMGVRYYGRDGLGNRMMSSAMKKGLPMNAYLNGEGLIRYSGSETYRKALFNVSDPAGQARQVIDEITVHLEKGSILSFSTETRGHTGIVSNKDGAWTYINSGVMDNPVDTLTTSKGVGEESLDREIEDWFRLAAQNKESLVITLGKLNQNKLAAYGAGGKPTVS